MKLQNQDIWLAYPKLVELSKIQFPVKISLGLAKLAMKLQQPYAVIEHERIKLVNRHGVEDKEKKTVTIDAGSPESGDFAREFGELLNAHWDDDFQLKKVKLPKKIVATCEGCGKKTTATFLINPQLLMPLQGYFVE